MLASCAFLPVSRFVFVSFCIMLENPIIKRLVDIAYLKQQQVAVHVLALAVLA